MLKNWKTSLLGLFATAPTIVNLLGPVIPPPYAQAALGIFGLLAFIMAKDGNVTGGTVKQ